jgi:Fe-S-cluster containining protein
MSGGGESNFFYSDYLIINLISQSSKKTLCRFYDDEKKTPCRFYDFIKTLCRFYDFTKTLCRYFFFYEKRQSVFFFLKRFPKINLINPNL